MNTTLCFVLDYYSSSQELPTAAIILILIFDVLIIITSLTGNILVLIALRKSQSLHPPSKALFASLAVSDLGVGLFAVPLHFTTNLAAFLQDSTTYCRVSATNDAFAGAFAGASFLTTTTIAVDRYLAFRLRIRYREVVTLRRVVAILIAEWIGATAWSLAGHYLITLKVIISIFSLVTCIMIASFCYLRIFIGLRNQVAQIHGQQHLGTNIFNVGQLKNSVISMFLVYCCLVLCNIPIFAVAILLLISEVNASTITAVNISVMVTNLNSSLNPSIYCWRVNEIRQEVRRILQDTVCA